MGAPFVPVVGGESTRSRGPLTRLGRAAGVALTPHTLAVTTRPWEDRRDVRFELLGPLRVLEGGCDLTPARPKQRALLALLLLRRGEVVAGARLIEALWGEDPPGSAQKCCRSCLEALRKLLGAERIRTRPPGYLLQLGGG